ncbi:hypothetical protein QE152_g1452 [Popillia japonica]|uniref:Uncharacterized protein n=1 Tax=Popillia japonica TaxID=7064 RepID=A0AAW1N8G7_POPJA
MAKKPHTDLDAKRKMEDQILSVLTIKCEPTPSNEPNKGKTHSSNISSQDIDKETIDKLRGDAIGDTMYRGFMLPLGYDGGKGCLRVLISVEWNKSLEEDLCYLWDMTVEKDVCEYLYQLSFPSMATAIILKHTEPRLIEIIIGILGNICSNNEVDPDITDVEISIVLNAMETLSKITTDFKIDTELLDVNVLESLLIGYRYLTNKKDGTNEKTGFVNVLESLLIGYRYLTNKKDGTNEKTGFDDEVLEDTLKLVNLFVQTLLNLALYVNELSNSEVRKDFLEKSQDISVECREIIKNSTKAIISSTDFYFESFTIIFPIFNVKYDRDMFVNLLEIISIIIKSNETKISPIIELVRYFVSKTDVKEIVTDSEGVKCDVEEVLKIVSEHKSECEFNFKENLNSVIEGLKKNVK